MSIREPKATFWIVTMIGGKQVRVRECGAREEAERIAGVLTECAESNPRNSTPLHWVEDVTTHASW